MSQRIEQALAAARLAQQQPPPGLMVATPINDVQLLVLTAAHSTLPPAEAVAWAKELFIEAVLQAGNNQLVAEIQQRAALRNGG